jgi:hypothetical protein
MKIIVVHDEYGNIRSAALTSPLVPGKAGLKPPSGFRVSEVDMPGNYEDITDPKTHVRLREIVERYKIEPTARLSEKRG